MQNTNKDNRAYCGIYEIKNVITNKRYIGQSMDIHTRWQNHRHELNGNRHGNDYLQKAWNKYGEDAFSFNIIEECEEEDLVNKESFYITLYQTLNRDYGYNLQIEIEGRRRFSEETKKKLSEFQKNRWTDEMRAELSEKFSGQNNPFYGKTHSDETRQKIAETNRKRVWSEESRSKTSSKLKGRLSPTRGKPTSDEKKKKLSQALKGRPSPNRKAVIQLSLQNTFIAEFESITSASKNTGIGIHKISQCCNGYIAEVDGYKWEFKEEKYEELS